MPMTRTTLTRWRHEPQGTALDERIGHYLARYADFLFDIDYDQWTVSFRKAEALHIKVSRGEENICRRRSNIDPPAFRCASWC